MSTPIRLVLAAGLLASAIGAGTSLAGPPQKTGSTITLTLAGTEGRGRPSIDIAEVFAERVKALSKDSIIVKIAYDSGGNDRTTTNNAQEANLVRLVRAGKVQLAIVPTRAFDFEGVTSFQAIQAPFLVTTERGMDRLTRGTLADRLQSELPQLGLTGLGLAPEGLRRPFGFTKALVKPADFAGIRFVASRSRPLVRLLRILGARPVALLGSAEEQGIANRTVAGSDSTLALAGNGGLPQPAFTGGNLVFFPKIDALVANGRSLNRLSSKQVSLLRAAAASARSWAIGALTEQKGRDAYCRAGGTIVTAPAAAITALRAKAAPVLAAMRRDPLTRSLIADISASSLSGGGVAPCSHGSTGLASGGPTVTKVIPAGVYRKTVTEHQLLAAGAPPHDAKINVGTWTLTATANGYQQIHIESPYPERTGTCEKRKMFIASTTSPKPAKRGLVAIEFRGKICSGDFGVAWKLVPGGIEFTRVSAPDPVLLTLWSGVFWKRVG
ncbi:MAG: TRAP transporter substrate-binding protein [Gaiellaceae bacterium]